MSEVSVCVKLRTFFLELKFYRRRTTELSSQHMYGANRITATYFYNSFDVRNNSMLHYETRDVIELTS